MSRSRLPVPCDRGRRPKVALLGALAFGLLAPTRAETPGKTAAPEGRILYVRQTVGDDLRDGSSPAKAFRTLSRVSRALRAGDTVYVGPGLYRERWNVRADGTADQPITLIGDATGAHTGDPPGAVMISGSDPVEESRFEPDAKPGVYRAAFPDDPVLGVVEMDGDQRRYLRARITREHLVEQLSELEVVSRLAATYYYDEQAKILHLHTSDGRPPETHELELARRTEGIAVTGKHFVTIMGFTIRHVEDAGIRFFTGAGNGMAIGNVVYGSRQGIRVYEATHVLIQGNTLFRNENSGVYFAKGSTHGQAVGNTLYENAKGARWSSGSANGLAAGNVAFDNAEAGISVESTPEVRVTGNRLVNNQAQLVFLDCRPLAEGNCLERRGPLQLTAERYPSDRYETLSAYRAGERRDMGSTSAGCGPLPERLDVRKLHAEATTYAERARKLLAERPAGGGVSLPSPPPP